MKIDEKENGDRKVPLAPFMETRLRQIMLMETTKMATCTGCLHLVAIVHISF